MLKEQKQKKASINLNTHTNICTCHFK